MIFSNFFLLIFLHLSFFSIMIYIEILSRTQLVRVTTFYENSPKPIDVLPKDGESAETGRRVESFSHSARQADTEALLSCSTLIDTDPFTGFTGLSLPKRPGDFPCRHSLPTAQSQLK